MSTIAMVTEKLALDTENRSNVMLILLIKQQRYLKLKFNSMQSLVWKISQFQ